MDNKNIRDSILMEMSEKSLKRISDIVEADYTQANL